MSSSKDAWGIEVGSQAIKVVKLSRTNDGVALEDFDVLPFKHVLTTPDLNVEEAIRVNLDSLAQKHEFDKSTVVVSVPGNMAFARFAKLPPIESSKVKSIVAYEAQQQIPFPIDEVEWDYHVFEEEDAPDIEVGIFAITKEKVAHFLSNYRSVGVRVDTLTLSPVAVYNAFAFENEITGDDNTVYLDIGTNSTDIIVVESGSIWLRTLQLGGNHFTNALMKQFKISFAKAEKLKHEAATSKYAKQIFQAMRGVFSELVTEIQRSLGFYTSLNRDAELTKIVGVGSTWKLPGLQKYLQQNLQMEVSRPDGFARLKVEDRRAAEFSSVAVNMATAYGLALQGLGLSQVDANVLPQSILLQRMWQAKRPWIGAAAACVAAAPLLGVGTMLVTSSTYESALGAVQGKIQSTINTAQQFKSDYDQVQTNDPRPGIRNFRRSFDYSNLYPRLMEDVVAAMATVDQTEAYQNVDWDDPESVARLAEIPRSERQAVAITNIDAQYIPPPAPVEQEQYEEDDPSQDPYMEDEEFGPLGPPAAPPPSAGSRGDGDRGPVGLVPLIPFPDPSQPGAPGEGEAGQADDDEEQETELPRIAVTVEGTTTMARSTISRVLQEKFVGWLEANEVRADRPYIIVSELKEPRFSRRGVSGDNARSRRGAGGDGASGDGGLRRTPTPKTEEPSSRPRNPGGIGLPGLGLPAPGEGEGLGRGSERTGPVEVRTPEGWYAPLGNATGGFSADALLPRRPLSIEDASDDIVFKFTFEVILLPPDKARPTILGERELDGLDTEQDPATPPTPQADNDTTTKPEDRA